MTRTLFRLSQPEEYRKAGPSDLIEMLPVPGHHPIFLRKADLEALTFSICTFETCHLSGPTGTAKSSLLEALDRVPANFRALCAALGFSEMPLRLFPVEMVIYETPGELYQRRALREGTTFDEKSRLVECLEEACRLRSKAYPLIWLRELGRVHSPSVQGGLLDMMTRGDIILSDGTRINGQGISWVADSNYQAEQDATHTLVAFDDALKRRFSVNITLNYLSAEQEAQVVREILKSTSPESDLSQRDGLIEKGVQLGHAVRRQKAEGNLLSVPAPTIWGYLAFLRMAVHLPHLTPQQVAMSTLLGLCSREDRKQVSAVLNEVFGLQAYDGEDPAINLNLF
jgi:hypothetical protein